METAIPVLLLLVIGDPSDLDIMSDLMEQELRTEKADVEDLSSKLGTWLSKNDKIEGKWDSHYWHDGPHLTIRKTKGNEYAVTHFARGDLFSFKLQRTATFRAGVLTFNKPVKEYLPVTPYTRFYLLDTPRGLRFASQATVREDIIGRKRVNWDFLDSTYLLILRTEKDESKK